MSNASVTIDINTPVAAVLESKQRKPLLVRLAQLVFDRSDLEHFRVFSQFRAPEDLATVIEAKRKNVFDYLVCVQHTDHGLKYPDTTAVMSALELAMAGHYPEISLESLGLIGPDGEEIASLETLCPGSRESTSKPRKAAKSRKVLSVVPDPVVEADNEVEDIVEEEEALAPEPVAAKAPKTRAVPRAAASSDVGEQVEQLSKSLEAALVELADLQQRSSAKVSAVVEDEVGYLREELAQVRKMAMGTLAYLHLINENLKQVFMYLDPVEQLGDLDEETLAVLSEAFGTDSDAPTHADPVDDGDADVADEEDEEVVEQKPAPKPPAQKAKAAPAPKAKPPAAAKAPETPGVTLDVSREDLMAMTLPELRELAEKVGVPNPASIPYKTSLVNRICSMASA